MMKYRCQNTEQSNTMPNTYIYTRLSILETFFLSNKPVFLLYNMAIHTGLICGILALFVNIERGLSDCSGMNVANRNMNLICWKWQMETRNKYIFLFHPLHVSVLWMVLFKFFISKLECKSVYEASLWKYCK